MIDSSICMQNETPCSGDGCSLSGIQLRSSFVGVLLQAARQLICLLTESMLQVEEVLRRQQEGGQGCTQPTIRSLMN